LETQLQHSLFRKEEVLIERDVKVLIAIAAKNVASGISPAINGRPRGRREASRIKPLLRCGMREHWIATGYYICAATCPRVGGITRIHGRVWQARLQGYDTAQSPPAHEQAPQSARLP